MEVRISGVNLAQSKHIDVALTAIYGIGRKTAVILCQQANVHYQKKVKDLTEAEIESLRSLIKFPVEGELRRKVAMDIKRKIDIGSYQGIRHRRGLPLKQRTRTNARTRKGRRKSVK